MRRIFIYVLLFTATGMFSKCVYPEQDILYDGESSLSFPAFASNQFTEKEIYVNTNVSNWQANCNQTWCNVTKTNENTVSISVTENTTNTSRIATITISAGDLTETVSVEQTIERTRVNGVVINGVCWATCNVDKPGVFAVHLEDAGMLYQYNRRVGWSTTDPMINSNGGTTWDSSEPIAYKWEKTNDPSPTGWRVPTLNEIQSLLDTKNVAYEWTTVNGKNGGKFTDRNTGNTIFLPAAGLRDDATLIYLGIVGIYWSDNPAGCYLGIDSNDAHWANTSFSVGHSVRPVANF